MLQQEFRDQSSVLEINEVVFDVDTNQDKVASDLSDKGLGKSADTTLQPNEMDRVSEVSSKGTVKNAQQQAVLRDETNLHGRKRIPRSATLSKIGGDLMKLPPAKTRLVRSQSTQIKRSGIKPPRRYTTRGA